MQLILKSERPYLAAEQEHQGLHAMIKIIPEGPETVKGPLDLAIVVDTSGSMQEEISGGGRVETPERNDIPDLLARWQEYKASKFTKPPGVEANSVLEPGSKPPRCWWADIKTLAENDFNLAAGRYKPQVAEAAPEEDPVELIKEVLVIEKDIANGLERLLREIEASG